MQSSSTWVDLHDPSGGPFKAPRPSGTLWRSPLAFLVYVPFESPDLRQSLPRSPKRLLAPRALAHLQASSLRHVPRPRLQGPATDPSILSSAKSSRPLGLCFSLSRPRGETPTSLSGWETSRGTGSVCLIRELIFEGKRHFRNYHPSSGQAELHRVFLSEWT